MRIAYLSGSYVPDRGADSIHVVRMCEALASLGHEVTLHARPGAEAVASEAAYYGIAHPFVIQKHWRPQVRLAGALAYGGLVAAHLALHAAPDLIYSREVYGLSFARGLGIPFVFESHWRPKHAVQKRVEAGLLRAASFRRLVVISAALQRIYLTTFPWLARSSITIAHDAANVQPRLPETPPRTGDRLQVGYVGGFLPGYGLELIAALARARPRDDFHVVGGRDAVVAEWRARTKGVENLTFHGFVPPANLSRMYAGFDVMLAPFQASTAHIDWISPMKLFEYMSYGKPMICSDFPVMREVLEDGVNALLVPAADLDRWHKALDRLTEPTSRRELGEQARRKLTEHYTWRTRAQNVLQGLA